MLLQLAEEVQGHGIVGFETNTVNLRPKGGEERTESSKSGILSERKKEGTFSCTDYGNWM
jgi:hypothetical protein